MQKTSPTNEPQGLASPHFAAPAEAPEYTAWEEIDAGRFMPRRVRGSCVGRALGWTFVVPSSGSDDTPERESK